MSSRSNHQPKHLMQSNSLVALSAVLIAGSRSLAESSTSSSEVIIPRASPGSKDSVLRIPSGRFIEIEGYTIGDEHRSEMSSKQFFDSIDKDKDGKLGHPELSQYLMNHIGGSNLDTTEEADEEAKSIMDRLDHNQDDELDSKDMYRFWEGLESLLTVDEVAEWIEHSLQLPPKIAQVFRANHVTGYDFPELVDNDGKALIDDLKIQNAMHRKKIMENVKSRLLGIGSKPKAPTGFTVTMESCSTALLTWKKPSREEQNFPVHKFRVQRRPLISNGDYQYGNHSRIMKENECLGGKDLSSVKDRMHANFPSKDTIPNDSIFDGGIDKSNDQYLNICTLDTDQSRRQCVPIEKSLEWQDVYNKGDNEFHDFGLQRGNSGYQYRIQSWNTVGKSTWVLQDISKKWKRNKCTRKEESQVRIVTEEGRFWCFLSWFSFLFSSAYSFGQTIMAMFTVFVAYLKYRRANLSTSVSPLDLGFPLLFEKINAGTSWILGFDIISPSVRESKSPGRDSLISYDDAAGLNKCNGYDQVRGARVKRKSTVSMNQQDSTEPKTIRQARPPLKQLNSTKTNLSQVSELSVPEVENITVLEGPTKKIQPQLKQSSFRNRLFRSSSQSSYCSEIKEPSGGCFTVKSETAPLTDTDNQESLRSENSFNCDDDSLIRCNSCNKKYRFPKRKRHHCAICYATFCHKCGKTTHTNLVSCKVPGNCICNRCLKPEQRSQR